MIPNMIWVERKVTNIVCVCHTWITMSTYIFTVRSTSYVWHIFTFDERILHQLVVRKTPILSISDHVRSIYYVRQISIFDESIACRLVFGKTKNPSILDYADASRMVYTTHIMSVLRSLYGNASWDSSILASICKIACDEVWEKMSLGDGISYRYLVGMPIMILNGAS